MTNAMFADTDTLTNRVIPVLVKLLRDEHIPDTETRFLEDWINASPHHKELFHFVINEGQLTRDVKAMLEIDNDAALQRCWHKIGQARRDKRLRYLRRVILVLAMVAVACILFALLRK